MVSYPEQKKAGRFQSDTLFNELYPLNLQVLAKRHFTPLSVAREAAAFLAAGKNARILDIGSGAGKFCLAGAHYQPGAFFYGVEQRKWLVEQAEKMKKQLRLENVSFLHANFTEVNFSDFQHFYFYNAFFENLVDTDAIDNDIQYSAELYQYYSRFLYNQLKHCPAGTKLVTFHSMEDEIPGHFSEKASLFGGLLKLWQKEEG